VRVLDDETLVYDLERHEAHCLSEPAALVWNACDGTRSIAELAALLPASLDPDGAQALALLALDELEPIGLIDARPVRPQRLSRQQLLRRAGVGAVVVAVPLVTSLVVPEPAAAVSCGATSDPCTQNSDCCSEICAGVVCL
jgi:hypothetical protein